MSLLPTPKLIDFPRVEKHRAWHVWYQFCDTAKRHGLPAVKPITGAWRTQAIRQARRLGMIRPLPFQSDQTFLVPVVWAREDFAFPQAYRHPILPICNDCWEPQFSKWERMLKRHRIKKAFFTSRIAGAYFAERIPGLDWQWLPESIDPTTCDPARPLIERTTDLVEFGRTLPVIRESSRQLFEDRGYRYRGAENDKWVTASQPELVALLGDSRLAACFPKTMTHLTGPYAPGRVETVTFRYFEVIANGCLPYGHCPLELSDLFGYNPVIEADLTDPASQLDDILKNISNYQNLADQNLSSLYKHASCDIRIKQVLKHLQNWGFDTPSIDQAPIDHIAE